MRIGLNALALRPGRIGGTETYFRNLVSSLAHVDQENEYIVLCSEESFHSLELPASNFQKLLVSVPSKPVAQLPKRILRKARHLQRGQRFATSFQEDLLAEKIDRLRIDLIHHPFGVIYPLSVSSASILTFWDMQHEFFPEFFSEDIILWRKRNYRSSVDLARHVIVSSKFTQETIISNYGISPDKITTIYFGVGPEFQQPIGLDQIAKLRAQYGLCDRVIFYPAATFPHKNHIHLLQAFKMLCDRTQQEVQLVLTGAEMTNEDNLRLAISELGLQRQVKRLGYVPAQELPAFYAAAAMMVFPSLFEGYGIPLIEAMAVGCPIICSNVTSMPELVGDAALLVDPMDVDGISRSMFRLLTEKELADDLIVRGQHQSGKFSWRQAASKTFRLYEAVCNVKYNP